MPYNVLHTLGSAQAGFRSYARIVSAIAAGISDAYRIHAWFLGENGPAVSELEQAGAIVRVFRLRGFVRDPIGVCRLWAALKQEKWAIAHIHAGGDTIRGLVRSSSSAKTIVHLHALNTSDTDPGGYAAVLRTFPEADAIIATSQAVASTVRNAHPRVVYPGVRIEDSDEGFPQERNEATLTVGAACRLVAVKGIANLIEALALLRYRFPNVKLEIAGLGPERSNLENQVKVLELTDRVSFLGWQQNIGVPLARWNVFAMPSLQEAFGISALEAMAAGLPVVASRVGGLPELVVDGQTGWLTAPGNVNGLADKLSLLFADKGLRSAMGAAGRARARSRFSIERMSAEIEKIYQSVLSL